MLTQRLTQEEQWLSFNIQKMFNKGTDVTADMI